MTRRLFRRAARSPAEIDAEMREEIEAHVAIGVEHLVRRGVDPTEAERRVRARFGDLERAMPALYASARRRSRVAQRREWLGAVGRDLAFAARQLRRSPGLAAGVVLSLGFGIGASATVFSWMEGTVLRPLPAVREIERVISVRPELRNGFGISTPEFEEWRDQMRTVSGLVAANVTMFAVQPGGGDGAASQPLYGMFVSAGYFDLLGVRPALGRAFLAADDRPGAPPVAVISDAAWRQHFGASPAAVGRVARINGQPVRIVGVAPANFGGTFAAARLDVWVPLEALPLLRPADAGNWRKRDARWLDAIGRLRPGVTLAAADAEVRAIARRQAATFVESRGRGARAIPLDVGEASQLLPLFASAVAVTGIVVLLICANVANLLLARASARSRELAVRLSLGATRRRLVIQLMVESALLASLGAALGLAFAANGHRLLAFLTPPTSITIATPSGLDGRFVVFVVGVTAACVLAFGLVPALVGSHVDVVDTLKNGARGSSATRSRMRTVLVVAQFAFALSTLVAAAMFLRFHVGARGLDVGFRGGDRVLLVQTEMGLAAYSDVRKWQQTIDLAAERIAAEPGVEATAVATFVPLGIVGYWRTPVEVAGRPVEAGAPERVLINGVSPRYFDLMGIPVVAGRAISSEDVPGRPLAAVVNQAFAARYFPDRAAVGQAIRLGGVEHVVVGVTPTGRYDYRELENPATAMVYYAWRQQPSGFVTLHVRTRGNPMALAASVRRAVRSVDSNLPLFAPETLDDHASVPFAISRSAFTILAVLGVAALVLASMGLFSVVSYGVALRTQEIGIRVALGATGGRVVGMFVAGAARLIAYGAAVGIPVAAGVAAVVRNRVAQLPAIAASEYAVPLAALALAALAAALVPARRAAAIDPARTLRAD